jgi:hypothetical protein
VYTFHIEIFIGERLVTINTILAHEAPPFYRGCAGGKVNSRAQEKQYACCHVYTVFVQENHFTFQYEIQPFVVLQSHVLRVGKNSTTKHTWSIGVLVILDFRL